jgi:bacterioferritin-associated ferredoxin
VKYDDATVSRRVAITGEQVVAARISGDARAVGDLAPEAAISRGRTVCNCFDVAESEIDAFLAAHRSLEALQEKLRCGTNCGSCLPELRKKAAACEPSPEFSARV